MGDEYTTRLLDPRHLGRLRRARGGEQRGVGRLLVHGLPPRGRGQGAPPRGNREAKRAHTQRGSVHQVLVYADGACVGWCQYGSPAELPNIKNPAKYEQGRRAAAGLADRLHLHRQQAPRARGRPSRRGRRAGGDPEPPAAASWRPTRSRPWTARLSAAPTCTPDRRSCSRASASSATARSPSGAG